MLNFAEKNVSLPSFISWSMLWMFSLESNLILSLESDAVYDKVLLWYCSINKETFPHSVMWSLHCPFKITLPETEWYVYCGMVMQYWSSRSTNGNTFYLDTAVCYSSYTEAVLRAPHFLVRATVPSVTFFYSCTTAQLFSAQMFALSYSRHRDTTPLYFSVTLSHFMGKIVP